MRSAERRRELRRILALAVLLGSTSCGLGLDFAFDSSSSSSFDLNVLAIKGSIDGGTVTLYLLDDSGARIRILAQGKTDKGLTMASFTPADGPIEAVIDGGTYTDEATGESKTMGTFNMRTRLSKLPRRGTTIILSALTEMAVRYSESQNSAGTTLAARIETANTAVAAMAGLQSVTTSDQNPAQTPTDLTSDSAKYGLVLSAICQQAKDNGVDSKDMISALADDISDGEFNGKKGANEVEIKNTQSGTTSTLTKKLSSDAWTSGLTTAMETYIKENPNNPGYTVTAVPTLHSVAVTTSSTAVQYTTVTDVRLSNAAGTYKSGDTLYFEIAFTNAVTVSGTPTLSLVLSNAVRTASYSFGSGTKTLVFGYTIQAADTATKLEYTSMGALALNGGTVRDSVGLNAVLKLPQPGTAGSLGASTGSKIGIDTTAPTISSSTLSVTVKSATTVSLSWTKATDNVTAQDKLQYQVYRSTSNNLASVSDAEKNGTAVGSFSADLNGYLVTGLTEATTYYFNVVVQDAVGNKSSFTSTLATPDKSGPTPGGSGALTATSSSGTALSLSWTKASDNVSAQSSLKYLVYRSLSNNLGSVANVLANGTAIGSLEADISSKAITGLTEGTTYYLNVLVQDLDGNQSVYTATSGTPDGTGPTPGSSGTITAAVTGSTSVSLTWTRATDSVDAQSSLKYQVYYSTSNNITSVANAIANGTASGSYTADVNYRSVSGLTAGTTYYFNVLVEDLAGNRSAYTPTSAVPDGTAPTPGSSGALTVAWSGTTLTMSWTAATDNLTSQAQLKYLVYRSTANNISTVANAEANGTAIGSLTSNLTSTIEAGLSANTTYYLNVVVQDASGNKAAYTSTSTILDTTAPTAGTAITFSSTGLTSTVATWGAGSDSVTSSLQYKVVKATSSGSINAVTLADAITSGSDLITNWTASITTATLSGLSPGTVYYAAVLVKDDAGNKTLYSPQSVSTTSGSFNATLNYDGGAVASNVVAIEHNNKIYIAFREATNGNSGGIHVKEYDPSTGTITLVSTASANGLNYGTVNPGWTRGPSLSSDGVTLYLSWQESADGTVAGQVRVKRWNGTTWTSMDGGGTTSTMNVDTAQESMAAQIMLFQGNVYMAVAQRNSSGQYHPRMLRFTGGSTWVPADGGVAIGTTNAPSTGLPWGGLYTGQDLVRSFATSTMVGMAFRDTSSTNNFYWTKYDGTSWTTPVSLNLDTAVSGGLGDTCHDGTNYYAAWPEGNGAALRVKRFINGAWQFIDGGATAGAATGSGEPVGGVRVLCTSGAFYVTWQTNNTGKGVLRKFSTATASVTAALEGWSWPYGGSAAVNYGYTNSIASDLFLFKRGTGIYGVWIENSGQLRMRQFE